MISSTDSAFAVTPSIALLAVDASQRGPFKPCEFKSASSSAAEMVSPLRSCSAPVVRAKRKPTGIIAANAIRKIEEVLFLNTAVAIAIMARIRGTKMRPEETIALDVCTKTSFMRSPGPAVSKSKLRAQARMSTKNPHKNACVLNINDVMFATRESIPLLIPSA